MEENKKINKISKILNIIFSVLIIIISLYFIYFIVDGYLTTKKALANDPSAVNGFAIAIIPFIILSIACFGIDTIINLIYCIIISAVDKEKALSKGNKIYSIIMIFIPIIINIILLITYYSLNLTL